MLAKLNKNHGSNKNYVKPRLDLQASICFNHFAGMVFYDARDETRNVPFGKPVNISHNAFLNRPTSTDFFNKS